VTGRSAHRQTKSPHAELELSAMAAIPVLFSMVEPARCLNIPDSLDINEANNCKKQL